MAGGSEQLIGYVRLVDPETSAYLKILDGKLDLILDRILSLTEQGNAMSAEVDRIKASVAGLTSISHSAITLLTELGNEIRARQDDPAALTALANEVDQRKQELAAAITANTPAAPPPPTNPPTPGTPTAPTAPAPTAGATPGGAGGAGQASAAAAGSTTKSGG
jgi:ABC-type transporter Mla MlaB component